MEEKETNSLSANRILDQEDNHCQLNLKKSLEKFTSDTSIQNLLF